jgi:hypothetical protein
MCFGIQRVRASLDWSVSLLLPQSETMADDDLEDWLRINYNILNPNEVIQPVLTN